MESSSSSGVSYVTSGSSSSFLSIALLIQYVSWLIKIFDLPGYKYNKHSEYLRDLSEYNVVLNTTGILSDAGKGIT